MSLETVRHTGISSLKVTENEVNTQSTDLFSAPVYDRSMTDAIECSHSADNLDHNGPFRITVKANDAQYMQTKKMQLLMTLSVVREDGTKPTIEGYAVAPNIGASLFQAVQVWIKGQKMSDLTQEYYGYKSWLENVCSYGPRAMNSQFSTAAFHADTPGKFDNLDYDGEEDEYENKGFEKRVNMCAEGKQFQVMTDLSVDVFQTDTLFLPCTEFTLVFEKSPDTFHIHKPESHTERLKIKIHEMKIYMNYINLHEDIRSHHMKYLSDRNAAARYMFQKTQFFTKQFGTGVTKLDVNSCVQGTLPRSVLVGLLKTPALDGDYALNPFNFQTFNVRTINLRVNNTIFPSEPISVDYTNNLYARACKRFFTELGVEHQDIDSFVNYNSFAGGYCLYAFDLTPDKCNGFHLHDSKTGDISVRIDLTGASTESITMMVISSHDKMLTLDGALNAKVFDM